MMHSEAINEIAAALAKAQGEIEGAEKSKVNPAFKSKYADLASVWDAARAPLSKNGLAVVQIPTETPEGMMLVSMLTHSSGQWFSSRYPIRPVQATPQGVGSALSYARRYSLMAMVGIAPEDDDGEAAMGRHPANCQPAKPSPAPVDLRKSHEALAVVMLTAIDKCETSLELQDWWKQHWPEIKDLPEDLRDGLIAGKDERKGRLAGKAA